MIDYDDEHRSPPWKVDPPSAHCDVWSVTTARGNPRDEYDILEDPPEWLARLIVAAPKLIDAARELIGCARDWIDGCGNEANTRDAIARLEAILKENP